MLAVVQFPVADTRSFIGDSPMRLGVPQFPNPKTWGDPEFVRCFGAAVRRRRGADPAWGDEVAFCRADGALRFPNLAAQPLGRAPALVSISSPFRRLFSDGKVVSRIEVGFSQPARATALRRLSIEQYLSVVADIMSLPTRVRCFHDANLADRMIAVYHPQDHLLRQGNRLARLYADATAVARDGASLDAQATYVKERRPLAVVDFGVSEIAAVPKHATRVSPQKVKGADVAFTWLDTAGGEIGVWIIRHKNPHEVRNLRICLLRLHAEREALNFVVTQLERGELPFNPGTSSGDKLEQYLNRATRLVQRDEWAGISQSAILEAFDAAESWTGPAERVSLLERFQGSRKNVLRKVELYEQSLIQSRQVNYYSYVEKGGDLVVGKKEQTGDQYSINAPQSQIGAIGSGATGTVSGNYVINEAAAKDIDVTALRTALDELFDELGKSDLPAEVKRQAQTEAGTAKAEGVKGQDVLAKGLVTHVEKVGQTLKEANMAVKEGTTLWETVKKVASVVGPLVGGAATVISWFV